ncbi:MAG: glycosyltransferase family 9 protein [Succinivibrio sp.]
MKKIKSICVLRLSALGDCINAFGLTNAITKKFKDIDVLYVLDKRFSSLFINDKGEQLVPMVTVDIKNDGLFRSGVNIYKELKSKKFDCLFNLQTSIKASFLSMFIRAKYKFGYDSVRRREGQRLFINKQVKSPDNPHVLAGFMAFANEVFKEEIEPCWDFKLTDTEIEQAKKQINRDYPEQKVIVISPASAKKEKNWTIKGYSDFAVYALEKGFKVVLVGAKSNDDFVYTNNIMIQTDLKPTNLCSETNLRELAAVISQADLVLSPDSAAMHLASALNVPVIGLFAIHNPNRVGAWNFRDLEVSVYEEQAQKELNGRKPGWRYRVRNPEAMENISLQRVIDAFEKACKKYIYKGDSSD